MREWASRIGGSEFLQRRWFQLAFSVFMGLAFFFLASWGLQPPTDTQAETTGTTPAKAAVRQAADSLALKIPADKVAISTPPFGAQALLASAQPGDRMDILALFPSSSGLPTQSAVVVRGATVVSPPSGSSGAPVVFAVTPEESLVVTHLVESGVPLTYTLLSASGAPAVAKQ